MKSGSISAKTPKNISRDMAEVITAEISRVTGRPRSEIAIDMPFMRMGIESLQAVTIAANLSGTLKTNIPVTTLFDYSTVSDLADYLSRPQGAEAALPLAPSWAKMTGEPIAIVGMGCRFPQADSVSKFWDLLKNGVDAITKTSRPEFAHVDATDLPAIQWGGFIDGADCFDNDAFSIAPLEASKMDPQQRLVLETCWQAIEDSGRAPSQLDGTRTGVFLGVSSSDYSLLGEASAQSKDIYDATGNAHSIAANRVSYVFNLKGPSIAYDTACSSSLTALHHACLSLRAGESDFALAGGVNLIFDPALSLAFAKAQMLSPDGRCKTFSNSANGYVRGEGAGIVVLKRLSDALRDGDHVWATIEGSAVNQDGRSSALTAPNGLAQEAVVRDALASAGLKSENLGYVEAHGTGTPLGDPVEFLSLSRVLGDRKQACAIGSVKTNIGHLEAAAGIAGVIKTVLSLKNQWLPQSLHFDALNSKIGDGAKNIEVVARGRAWQSSDARVAGVSSFGFGGTNAHVILKEYSSAPAAHVSKPSYLMTGFSASTDESLQRTAKAWRESIATSDARNFSPELSLSTRMDLSKKVIMTGAAQADIQQSLEIYLKGERAPGFAVSKDLGRARPHLAFLYTGQGSQSVGMGVELYRHFASYRTAFEDCCEGFGRVYPQDLFALVSGKGDTTRLLQTDYGQAAIFSMGYSLTKLLEKDFNLSPEIVLGHSLGEITAACAAGVMTLNDAVRLVAARGRLMQSTAAGAMVVAHASEDTCRDLLRKTNSSFEVAAINGPLSCVLSGPASGVAAVLAACEKEKIRTVRLLVDRAFHSSLMDPIVKSFTDEISDLRFNAPLIPLVSGLTGEVMVEAPSADYWARHLRQPTQFYRAMQTLRTRGCNGFLELGPHPTLIQLGERCVPEAAALWTSLQVREQNGLKTFYQSIAELAANGFWDSRENFATTSTPADRRHLPPTLFTQKKLWAFDGESRRRVTASAAVAMDAVDESVALDENEVLESLKVMVARLLQVEPNTLDVDEQLINFGADSLLLLNAIQTIKDRYRVSIPISDVFQDLSTLRLIAGHVVRTSTVSQAAKPKVATAAAPASVQIPTEVREKKGVLGNFSARADSLTTRLEDDKKTSYLNELIAKFSAQTKATKKHTQTFRKALADNRVSAGFRPVTKEITYPLICAKAKGSHFTDLDQNDYVDFTMGFGVNLFGHSPEFIETAVREQLDLGLCVGPQSALAGDVAQAVSDLTGSERVAFCNSGTEAVMTAIRLARAATGRSKIVLFDGSYHGHFDGVLARAQGLGLSIPVAPGVTKGFVEDIMVLDYISDESLAMIREHGHELAAVLVEPVQSRFPEQKPGAFLKELRKITEQSGTALIFDEVITGFRIHPGGAQAHFGVKADLASYGKVLGGGLPIGAVGGQAKFMDAIDGGSWQFGDPSYPKSEMTFFAGTFSKHPLAMAASLAVLKKMKAEGETITSELNRRTGDLARRLNEFFASQDLDIGVYNFGSLFRFKASANLDLFFYNLNLNGFYIWEGRNMFMSTAHTDADIESFISAVKKISLELIEHGFFKKKPAVAFAVQKKFPLLPSQLRFQSLIEKTVEGESASHICLAVKMKGELKIELLNAALQSVLSAYDAFRLRVDIQAKEQWFVPDLDFELDVQDVTQADVPWSELSALLKEMGRKPFDLKTESPFRFLVASVVEETAIFAMVAHHVAIDGWSIAQLIEDIAEAYGALEKNQAYTPPKTLAFEKFLSDPLRFGTEKKLQDARAYWHEKFKNQPIRHVRWPQGLSAQPTDLRGERVVFDIEFSLYDKLKKLALEQKLTPMMLMLDAFARTLHARTAQNELVIGVPAGNRDADGADKMIGSCANLLAVEVKVDTQAPRESVSRLKTEMLSCYKNMPYPYEDLEEHIGQRLFNVTFNVEPASELPDFGDVSLFVHPFPVTASEFDLTMNLTDLEYFYHGEIDFKTALFNDEAAIKLADEFVAKLRETVASLSARP